MACKGTSFELPHFRSILFVLRHANILIPSVNGVPKRFLARRDLVLKRIIKHTLVVCLPARIRTSYPHTVVCPDGHSNLVEQAGVLVLEREVEGVF